MTKREAHRPEAEELHAEQAGAQATGVTDGGWSSVVQAHYDPTERRELTTVIVGAIAEAEGVSITDVRSPPLYEVVDTAALEAALFGRSKLTDNGTGSSIAFQYNDYKIRVEADGWVTVLSQSRKAESD